MSEPSDAQRALIRDLKAGRRCAECAEPIEPGRPCETCAEKRAILRQLLPRIYGDS